MTLATDANPATEGPGSKPSGRKGWAGWVLSILVAVVLGAAALVYVWWHGRADHFEHKKATTVTYAMADKLTIQVSGGADVVLRSGIDQTVVETLQQWDGNTVPASETGYADTGALSLNSGCAKDCSVTFTVYVPLDTEVALTSTGGDITLVDVTGTVALTNDIGDVILQGTRVSALTITLNQGDVHGDLASVPTQLTVDVTKGDVDLDLPAAQYTVSASASGDSKVTVDQTPGATNQVKVTVRTGDLKLH